MTKKTIIIKTNSHKSQITFFIFFGFAIILATGIAIVLMSESSGKKTRKDTTESPKTLLKIQSIKDEINNCLTLTAKEALLRIGKQGGFLYAEQGGSTEDLIAQDTGKKYVEYDNYKTRYLVDEPTGAIAQIFFTTAPKYPWDLFPYTDLSFTTLQFSGYYGINNLPALYRPSKNSLQEQLEVYISNNIKKCVNFEKYVQQGLEINYSQPNVTLYIANETQKLRTEEITNFALSWPVTIKQKSSDSITMLNDFGATIRIPFAKIYYNVTSIINKESTNISYEPHTESTYSVLTTKIQKDSIVTIKFSNYIIDETQYEFRFARHSRIPALHYITQLKDSTAQTPINLPKGAKIFVQGNTLQFSPTSCSAADAAIAAWEYSSINLNASNPDGSLNEEIIFKLNPEDPKLDKPTGTHPIEIQIAAHRADDLAKKDSQTFYVNIYCCADAPCE